MMQEERKSSKSVLDHLKEGGVVDLKATLEEAVDLLMDELNCKECVAFNECADCYGQNTVDKNNPRCREVIRAFLSQDYKKNQKDEVFEQISDMIKRFYANEKAKEDE